MRKIKSTIPNTNIRKQLNNLRWDTVDRVIGQMNDDLYHYGWEMICDEVNRATSRPLFRVTTSLSNIVGEIS